MKSRSRLPKRLLSLQFAILMIATSFMLAGTSSSASPATENTALVPGSPVHYNWVGYAGNDTVYLSYGFSSNLLLSQSLPGTAGASAITAHTRYESTIYNASRSDGNFVDYNVKVLNGIEMATGGNIALANDSNFSFSEQYFRQEKKLSIAVPIVVAVKSVTLNESNRMLYVPTAENEGNSATSYSWQNISAWGVNVSSVITGFNLSNQPFFNKLLENVSYDEAVNSSTSMDQRVVGSNYWSVIKDLGSIAAGSLDTALPALADLDEIPGVDYITIPLTGLALLFDLYDLVQKFKGLPAQTSQIPDWRIKSYEPNPIYHNYTATNGTFWGSNWSESAAEFNVSNYSDSYTANNGSAYINYTNVFFCNEMIYCDIMQSYFNQSGYINLTAQDFVSQQDGGKYSWLNSDNSNTPLPGAKSTLSIHLVPANKLWGRVNVNGLNLCNQEILITQTDLNNNVTYFYEKTNANGTYSFMAHPGWKYEIQAVTPYGLTNSSRSVTPSGEGSTMLILYPSQSEFKVTLLLRSV